MMERFINIKKEKLERSNAKKNTHPRNPITIKNHKGVTIGDDGNNEKEFREEVHSISAAQ
jgi:hypothetical protein